MKYGSGRKLLKGIGKYEDKCEKLTEKRLPRWGKKAPVCYEYLGAGGPHVGFTCGDFSSGNWGKSGRKLGTDGKFPPVD